MKYLALCIGFGIILLGCEAGSAVSGLDEGLSHVETLGKTSGSTVDVQAFLPAGDFGGGVLEPGTVFTPNKSFSTIRRKSDRVSYNLHTTGLPPGAYTVWWEIYNNPAGCIDGCDVGDYFVAEADPSVFWSSGTIVQSNGTANFSDVAIVGETPEGLGQYILGNPGGIVNPMGAEIHLIIKYHGPASDDKTELYNQTHTIFGNCAAGANAYDYGAPFGVQCFDPQIAIHVPN